MERCNSRQLGLAPCMYYFDVCIVHTCGVCSNPTPFAIKIIYHTIASCNTVRQQRVMLSTVQCTEYESSLWGTRTPSGLWVQQSCQQRQFKTYRWRGKVQMWAGGQVGTGQDPWRRGGSAMWVQCWLASCSCWTEFDGQGSQDAERR